MLNMTSDQTQLGLRAMKTVALANGVLEAHELELLECATRLLGGGLDPATLEPVEPNLVAEVFVEPAQRRQLVEAMVVMSLMDGEATDDEVTVVERFAAALGVEDRAVHNIRQLAEGHLLRLRFDVARRVPLLRDLIGQTWEAEGLRGLWRLFRTIRGAHEDPEVAWKHKRLGLLPEGTLGRAVWVHMTKAGFAMPGEKGGLAERVMHHDITHVLGGFDTDAAGECEIAGFYAGMMGESAFPIVLGTLLMFHAGLKLSPIAEPAQLQWHPERVIAAVQRGAACKVQLWSGWDYWAVMDRPIAEVRAEYGIVVA